MCWIIVIFLGDKIRAMILVLINALVYFRIYFCSQINYFQSQEDKYCTRGICLEKALWHKNPSLLKILLRHS